VARFSINEGNPGNGDVEAGGEPAAEGVVAGGAVLKVPFIVFQESRFPGLPPVNTMVKHLPSAEIHLVRKFQ
jgi:hypothetical protein